MTACHIRCQACGFRLKTWVFFNLQKYLGCEPIFFVFLSEINFLTKFCGMDTLWEEKKNQQINQHLVDINNITEFGGGTENQT